MNVSITQPQPAAKISVKLVIGIFFTLLGVLLTLDNLDLADADRFLPYWPVVLIAIGILKLRDRRSRTFAVLAIVVGALFLTDLFRFSIFDYWPIALIFAGLALVARASSACARKRSARATTPAAGSSLSWAAVSSI